MKHPCKPRTKTKGYKTKPAQKGEQRTSISDRRVSNLHAISNIRSMEIPQKAERIETQEAKGNLMFSIKASVKDDFPSKQQCFFPNKPNGHRERRFPVFSSHDEEGEIKASQFKGRDPSFFPVLST